MIGLILIRSEGAANLEICTLGKEKARWRMFLAPFATSTTLVLVDDLKAGSSRVRRCGLETEDKSTVLILASANCANQADRTSASENCT